MKAKEEELLLKKKAEYFLKEKQAVHIVLRNSKFLNGQLEKVTSEVLIIDDQIFGKTTIFFEEIAKIYQWLPKEREV